MTGVKVGKQRRERRKLRGSDGKEKKRRSIICVLNSPILTTGLGVLSIVNLAVGSCCFFTFGAARRLL